MLKQHARGKRKVGSPKRPKTQRPTVWSIVYTTTLAPMNASANSRECPISARKAAPIPTNVASLIRNLC